MCALVVYRMAMLRPREVGVGLLGLAGTMVGGMGAACCVCGLRSHGRVVESGKWVGIIVAWLSVQGCMMTLQIKLLEMKGMTLDLFIA